MSVETAERSFRPLDDGAIRRLAEILGPEGLRTDDVAREAHGRDETEDLVFPPEVVALPETTEQVAALLRLASELRVAVTPRGAGTGLSGGALPVHGGIALGLARMDRIRALDPADLVAEVEAGVITEDLRRRAEEIGLYYPPDPGSRETCQLGGNLAENAAGPHSCKYGPTSRFVLGLEAVTADGRILRTGGRNRKDVAGYNLTQLLVGSEGTLAVITAATLRLIAHPAARLVLVLPFPTLEQGADAVSALFREGFDPAACELLDGTALTMVGRLLPLPDSLVGRDAVILLELDGGEADRLLEEAAALGELAVRFGAGEPLAAQDPAEIRRLWTLRSRVGEAVKHGSIYKEADAVVPRSRLAALVRAARSAAAAHGLEVACYGHAGDGNLHVNLLRGSLDQALWQERRDAAEDDLFAAVIELGGSITGEHGVGWTQRRFLPRAVDPVALDLMRDLKDKLDPAGILNPGKIFPTDPANF